MKRRIKFIYIVGIHAVLAIVILKSDFIDRVKNRISNQRTELPSEITQHFKRMLRYHRRKDGNVPDESIIFIGDSITQGLCVTAVVSPSVNYGIGSDTTVGVLQRLPSYKSIDRADVLVLAVGINDMTRRSNDEIIENYQSIIQQVPQTVPIVISAILPLDEELIKGRDGWNRDRVGGGER